MTTTPADLIGRTVTASQPGTYHSFTGVTVVGLDPLLTGFVRVQYDNRDGRGVMEARVHASRCEVIA
ncbi:MAG TPA: hypothetical protein VFG91_01955 [Woeseiaceae bacterium]|nr:hypothetical protein [Woeseiaceae bacterium]